MPVKDAGVGFELGGVDPALLSKEVPEVAAAVGGSLVVDEPEAVGVVGKGIGSGEEEAVDANGLGLLRGPERARELAGGGGVGVQDPEACRVGEGVAEGGCNFAGEAGELAWGDAGGAEQSADAAVPGWEFG